jgi:hypothetical protein
VGPCRISRRVKATSDPLTGSKLEIRALRDGRHKMQLAYRSELLPADRRA